jgi:hypothetical protein
MKKLLALLLLSPLVASEESLVLESLQEVEASIFNESIYYELFDEINSIRKPIKDPWMKDNEYQKILDNFNANFENSMRFYKLDLGVIGVSCNLNYPVCYDVESERVNFNIGSKYSEYKKTFNSSRMVSSYEGQTILQQNFNRKTLVTKIEISEDNLVFPAPSELMSSFSVPLDEMKTSLESFKAYLIFKINLFDEHQLTYARKSYSEPKIDSPIERIINSKEIYASMVKVSLEKDGVYYDDPNPIPKYRVSPFYPRKALKRKLNGSVKMSFTIFKDGSVGDIEVIEGICSEPKPINGAPKEEFKCNLFNKSAINAVKKFNYPIQDKILTDVVHSFTYQL